MKKKKKEGIGDEVYEGGGEGERWGTSECGREEPLFQHLVRRHERDLQES